MLGVVNFPDLERVFRYDGDFKRTPNRYANRNSVERRPFVESSFEIRPLFSKTGNKAKQASTGQKQKKKKKKKKRKKKKKSDRDLENEVLPPVDRELTEREWYVDVYRRYVGRSVRRPSRRIPRNALQHLQRLARCGPLARRSYAPVVSTYR